MSEATISPFKVSASRFSSHWWLILLFAVLGYVGVLYWMSVAPPSHEALAVLEVDMKEHRVMGAELEQERLSPEIAIATEASKLMGPGILAAVAESPEVQALQALVPPVFSFTPRSWRGGNDLNFEPASSLPSYEIVDRLVRDWLSISGRRNTSLIEVRVNHPDSESARVIADTILRVYLEKQQKEKSSNTSDTFQILKDEANEAHRILEDAEKSRQVYVSAQKLNESLEASRLERVLMSQRYKQKHPRMIQAEAVYRDVYQRFRREITRATRSEQEQDYWLEYRPAMTALDERISDPPSAITHPPSREARHQPSPAQNAQDEWLALVQNALSSRASRLAATVQHQQLRYQSITKRMTEIDVADENHMTNVRVIEPAFISKPLEITRQLYLAAGSAVGLLAGLGLTYLLGLIDYKIYDARSLEQATGLSCLSAIPQSEHFSQSRKSKVEGQKSKVEESAIRDHSSAITDHSVWQSVLIEAPQSPSSEALRNLRASISLLGRADRHRTLLVTSAVPGEGKTTVAAELAISFALNQERTLIVDFDLRRPRLADHFPMTLDQPGIVDVLAGQAELEDVILETGVDGLMVMGSGRKAPNPSELLQKDEIGILLKQLEPQFDRIIFDSAPILPVSDTRLLAEQVHSIITVVRARKAPIGAVIRTCDLIAESGGKLAGVVFNGVKNNQGTGYHGYGEYGTEE